MRDLLTASVGSAVNLQPMLAPELWPALVDATQIELAILNLAINAREAMPAGGTLRIATANVALGPPARPEDPPAGDYVSVTLTDTGTGMLPDVASKAFEPFFTTKPVGRGSGLGLAQVFGFARQSDGGVRLETSIGEGTTLTVFLPRALQIAAMSPGAPARPDDTGRVEAGRRVLVVDDDDAVRQVTAALLEDAGCAVVQASGGPAALELLPQSGAFDLMVVDFAMPGMNGVEVARAAASLHPEMPVLFVTGYADLSALAGVDD